MKSSHKKWIEKLDRFLIVASCSILVENMAKFSRNDTFDEKGYAKCKAILSKSSSYLQNFLCILISTLTTVNIAISVFVISQKNLFSNIKTGLFAILAFLIFIESIFVMLYSIFSLFKIHKRILKMATENNSDHMKSEFEIEFSLLKFLISIFISAFMSMISFTILAYVLSSLI